MRSILFVILFLLGTYKAAAEPLCVLLFDKSSKNRELEANFISSTDIPLLDLLRNIIRTNVTTEEGTFYFDSETHTDIPLSEIKNFNNKGSLKIGAYSESTTYYNVEAYGETYTFRIRFTASEVDRSLKISLVEKKYRFNISKFEYREKKSKVIESDESILLAIREMLNLPQANRSTHNSNIVLKEITFNPANDDKEEMGALISASDGEVKISPEVRVESQRYSLSLMHRDPNGRIRRIGFVAVGALHSLNLQEKSPEFKANRYLGFAAEIEPEWEFIQHRPALLTSLQKLATAFEVSTGMERTTMSKRDRAMTTPIQIQRPLPMKQQPQRADSAKNRVNKQEYSEAI